MTWQPLKRPFEIRVNSSSVAAIWPWLTLTERLQTKRERARHDNEARATEGQPVLRSLRKASLRTLEALQFDFA